MTAQRAVLRIPSNGAVGLAVKRCYPDLFNYLCGITSAVFAYEHKKLLAREFERFTTLFSCVSTPHRLKVEACVTRSIFVFGIVHFTVEFALQSNRRRKTPSIGHRARKTG
jgi:hypothetical protein